VGFVYRQNIPRKIKNISILGFHVTVNQVPFENHSHMAVGQNLVPLVNIKIAGKWMFIPLKMVLIGIDS